MKALADRARTSTWPNSCSPDILIDAAQTGRRMTLHPSTARQELEKLQRDMPAIPRRDRQDGRRLHGAHDCARAPRLGGDVRTGCEMRSVRPGKGQRNVLVAQVSNEPGVGCE